MEFFNAAVDVMKTVVVALGGGLGVWGAVNLLEGYGGDNPSAKSQGSSRAAVSPLSASPSSPSSPTCSTDFCYPRKNRLFPKRSVLMSLEFLTNLIFILNLLKTIISHFS